MRHVTGPSFRSPETRTETGDEETQRPRASTDPVDVIDRGRADVSLRGSVRALQTDPTNALRPVELAQNRPNDINGFWLGGPIVRVDDRAEVGFQEPTPGRAFRRDIIPTRYDPTERNLAQIPPILPRDGNVRDGPVTILVNGIDTSPQFALDNAQQYADLTGRPTVMLYNATSSPEGDAVESIGQMLRVRNDRAIENLADAIVHELLSGKPVSVAAESQGALMTRNALEMVRSDLLVHYGWQRNGRRPPTAEQRALADAAMARITVETYGGAADSYPYGPTYIHYVNEMEGPNEAGDAVAQTFGLGVQADVNQAEVQRRAGGDRAVVRYLRGFNRPGNFADRIIENHVFANYLHELEDGGWVPPDEAMVNGTGRIP
ncbi:MAG: hypothetical protein AAF735_01675 [Myxococcota bacterium]